MTLAYFDCFSGASGDMIIAALLDAGATMERLRSRLAGLPVRGFEIQAQKIRKQGFAATSFQVRCDEAHPHRHLHDVLEIIAGAGLPSQIAEPASTIFKKLADAEASVHGVAVERVHFHEVGAVDAIVDVVGACTALDELGVTEVHCSPIPTGSGTVQCAHGTMPIPAPATAALLRGVPLADSSETGELTTPTGAAILSTLAGSFGPLGGLTIERVGYGAGTRDGRQVPNLLRVLLGAPDDDPTADTVAVLEASIDDQSPELLGHAMNRLLELGALEAYCQPIYMKKGRPGLLLTVLCTPDRLSATEQLIFRETSTFGIRRRLCRRSRLQRRHDTVELDGTPIGIKVGLLNGETITVAPEYEDCRRASEAGGRSVKEIMSRALARWDDRAGAHQAPERES